jgi:hypothetical protein
MNPNGQSQPQLNIDLLNTTPIESSTGKRVFAEGAILRKVSKFVIGSQEDAVLPIPVMYDVETGEVVIEMLPKELREEMTEYNQNLTKNA